MYGTIISAWTMERSRIKWDTPKTVDHLAKGFHKVLKTRGLAEVVNIFIVSDHGMADTTGMGLDRQALNPFDHEGG